MGKDNYFMYGDMYPDPTPCNNEEFIMEDTFDYNFSIGLRERIAILMATNFQHMDEDNAFRLARRIEDYVITGDTGIEDDA